MSEQLFNSLLVTRLNYIEEESDDDEPNIIRHLKFYLLESKYQSPDLYYTYDEIDEVLIEFYKAFDINVSEQRIRDVTVNTSRYSRYSIQPDIVDFEYIINAPRIVNIYQSHGSISEHSISNVLFNILESNNDNNNIYSILNNYLQSIQQPHQMDDVVISLDKDDVEKLKKYKLTSSTEQNCVICLDSIEKNHDVIELKCKHLYHEECIKTYLEKYNHKCPICRDDVGKHKYNI